MGIIQCGNFSGNTTVSIGWEPQWIMLKRTDNTEDWITIDNMRGCAVGGVDAILNPNLSSAESMANDFIDFTATGFISKNLTGSYIYTVIRRNNKPPTTGTQVYNASTASGVVSAGFPVDLHIGAVRAGAANNHAVHSRLVGGTKELVTSSTAAESTITDLGFDSMTGLRASLVAGGVNHFFRRAAGFMDVVCTNDNGASQMLNHSLGVAPELIIEKQRTSGTDWWAQLHTINKLAKLNLTDAAFGSLSGYPVTSTTFKTAGFSSGTSVAYIFATKAGISKVGSYTGNGSTQTIDCGFSAGARFFLVKATSATGSWWIFDSVRGIVSAADPALQLNSTSAEITSADAVDPTPVGIIVNQEATCSINMNGVSYVYLAIA